MASTDARPIPRKGVAWRVTFPILDADGDLVSGAADLDSEVSKDGGTFADCTNEATEIATSSGVYYLDLTASEMDADTVAIVVKTSTSGAKTTPIIVYPEEAGDLRVDIVKINGDGANAGRLGSVLDYYDTNGYLPIGGTVSANVVQISGDSTAADNAEAFFDGTGYAGVNTAIAAAVAEESLSSHTTAGTLGKVIADVNNNVAQVATGAATVSANMVQISGDATAANNLEAALDGTGFPLGGARVSFGGNVKTQDYIEAFGVFTRAGALADPSAVLVDVTWVKMDGGAYTANVETGATPTLVSTGIYRRQRTTGYPYTGPGMMIFRFYTSDTTVDNRESIMWFNAGVGVEDYVVDPLAVDVDAILAKVSAIGSAQIVYMSPQVGSTLITIYQGDSYYGTKTQKLRWAVPLNVADLTGATVTFKLAQSPSNFTKACSVTGAGVDGSQLVELQLTAAETAAWAAATGVKFEVEASWSGPTEVKTIDVGTATITAQLT